MRTYDALNRKATETANPIASSLSIQGRTFAYDLKGRLTAANAPSWAQGWTYDAAGRVATATNGLGTFTYTWDRGSNLTGRLYPNGAYAAYNYDSANRPVYAYFQPAGGSTVTSSISYDALSRRTGITFPDGSSQTYSFNPAGEVATVAHAFPAASGDNVTYAYGYDPGGREVSRMISNAAYRYVPAAAAVTYTGADAINRYPSVGGITYTWRPAGELGNDGVRFYFYDEEHRLVSSTRHSDNAGVVFMQDARGQAYSRTTSQAAPATERLTNYALDGLNREVALERLYTRAAGTTPWTLVGDRTFLPGFNPDERLAFLDTDGTLRYPHTDRQGTTIALSVGGATAVKFKFGAYGESDDALTQAPGAQAYNYRFTGQRLDQFPVAYDYKARYYSPTIGRFLQPDPVGLQEGPNLYTYVRNDPVNLADPTGEEAACVTLGNCGRAIQTPTDKLNAIISLGALGGLFGGGLLAPAVLPAATNVVLSNAPAISEATAVAAEVLAPGAGIGVAATKVGAAKGIPSWTLGEGKSAARWAGQMERRGWTPSQIDEALTSGKQFSAPNNLNPRNGATRFVHPQTGRSVVIDNKTGQVIHVGGEGFKY